MSDLSFPIANVDSGKLATFMAVPSSANLAAALTDEIDPGAGVIVLAKGWQSVAAVVTLVGGAGNIVPQYVTALCRWMQIGKTVFLRYYLTGDGGNEGAGTGNITLALPVAVGASALGANSNTSSGLAVKGAALYMLTGNPTPGSTTVGVSYYSAINNVSGVAGADQNNISRSLIIGGSYEVD